MAQQINSKTFKLIVQNSKTYQLLVSGFTVTSLWFIQFLLPIVLSIVVRIEYFVTTTIGLTLEMDIGRPLLTSKITASFLNSIVLDALASLTYKVSSSIQNIIITDYIVRIINKVSTTFDMVNSISFTLITAIFNTLGDFDGDTLGTMDVLSLGDLDYTVV